MRRALHHLSPPFPLVWQLTSAWVDSLLLSPARGSGFHTASWLDASTLLINITTASPAISAEWERNASIRLSWEAGLMNAARNTLPANGSDIYVSGDWGILAGPTISRLQAYGGTGDATYSVGDTIELSFDVRQLASNRRGRQLASNMWSVWSPSGLCPLEPSAVPN